MRDRRGLDYCTVISSDEVLMRDRRGLDYCTVISSDEVLMRDRRGLDYCMAENIIKTWYSRLKLANSVIYN